MSVDVTVERTAVLKALAEPIRWHILECLAAEELCVCHLVEELDVAQPLVSHHLKVLRAAGLVETEGFRQWTYYRLRPEAFLPLASETARLAKPTGKRSDRRRPCC